MTLHLNGTSSTLGNGAPADKTYEVVRMPATCGTIQAGTSATDRGASTAAVSVARTITGCPTVGPVSVTRTSPTSGRLATTASSPLGRAIAAYRWTFGDGTTATTTTSTVDHTYASVGAHNATVVAVDAAGA